MNKFFVTFGLCLLTAGCVQTPTYRLGEFTVASSFNVKNLNYGANSGVPVTGEDCYKNGQKPNDDRLQRAMDNAIRNGHKDGVNGNLLVNVRIDQLKENKPGFLGLPEPYNCIRVQGDLVLLKAK